MTGTWPMRFNQGATVDLLLTWTTDEKVPIDVTGWSAAMQVRTEPGGTLLASLSSGTGEITMGGTAGTIRLLVAADVTTAWVWRRGVYDLLLTNPDDQATRLLEGPASVSAAVTV
jgi:hypothetical protein